MRKRIRTLSKPVKFLSAAAVGGGEEGRGNFGKSFDFLCPDDRFGEKTFERAEGEMARLSLGFALKKGKIPPEDVGCLFTGDLQNQCAATSLGLLSFGIPTVGLYGACSTCTEALIGASLWLCESPENSVAAAVTCSHNSAAERQFRTPLEYGAQRAPTAQWTATAAGAFLLGSDGGEGMPEIREIMIGKAIDGCSPEASNMGAAMAPAAADSIVTYLRESGFEPSKFDAIVTGDLGKVGSALAEELCFNEGYDISGNHFDCGCMLYDFSKQDVHAGASGCGCSASVLACHFLPELQKGKYRDILFLSTGALMSPTSVMQKQNIAGIAPVIRICGGEK